MAAAAASLHGPFHLIIDATGALTEAGVFNAASAGAMFDRVVFPVVNKGVDDSLTAVFTFTMS